MRSTLARASCAESAASSRYSPSSTRVYDLERDRSFWCFSVANHDGIGHRHVLPEMRCRRGMLTIGGDFRAHAEGTHGTVRGKHGDCIRVDDLGALDVDEHAGYLSLLLSASQDGGDEQASDGEC